MPNKENFSEMPRTKTVWDEENYMDILKSAIIQSNSVSRTGDKPMAALSEKFDSHLSYRLVHELAAASIIKRLAEGLNLNGELAYAGMMMHDVGHPFSAHDGEEIFTLIGKLYNCGYFHHNAKGVETIRGENILNTALGMIPNIEYRPQLRRDLERDFNYVLDIVISHDGEADPKDLTKRPQHYDTIEQAVEDKLRRSNTKNDYKFVSQTPEGMLAKYADVIAYLSSDVRDGFRLGIIKTFNDKYLEIFGRIVATSPQDIKDTEEGKAVAIEIAKAKIKEIQEKYLEEYTEDVKHEKNSSILSTARSIINEINEKKINTYMLSKYYDSNEYNNITENESENEMRTEQYEAEKEKIEEQINEILQRHLEAFLDEKGDIQPEQYEPIKADIIKITHYVNEMLYINTRVVNEVTSMVQEYFINDLIETTRKEIDELTDKRAQGNTKDDEEMCVPLLSKNAANLYIKAKNYGYTYYVPQTKTRYQKELLPKNVKRIVEYCAKGLIDDGVIQRKLCDGTIRSKIPQELLEYVDSQRKLAPTEPKKELRGFVSEMKIKHRYTPAQKNRKSKFNILEKLKRSVVKQGSRFANTYIYTCEAMEHQIRNKIAVVLSPDYHFKSSKTDMLEKQYEEELQNMRNRILAKYPNIIEEPQSEEDRTNKEEKTEQIIQEILEEERTKIVEKMAIQLSIDYVSGMTDEGIKDLAIDLGYMTQQQYEEAQNERGGEVTETIKKLQRMTAEQPTGEGR